MESGGQTVKCLGSLEYCAAKEFGNLGNRKFLKFIKRLLMSSLKLGVRSLLPHCCSARRSRTTHPSISEAAVSSCAPKKLSEARQSTPKAPRACFSCIAVQLEVAIAQMPCSVKHEDGVNIEDLSSTKCTPTYLVYPPFFVGSPPAIFKTTPRSYVCRKPDLMFLFSLRCLLTCLRILPQRHCELLSTTSLRRHLPSTSPFSECFKIDTWKYSTSRLVLESSMPTSSHLWVLRHWLRLWTRFFYICMLPSCVSRTNYNNVKDLPAQRGTCVS